MSDEWREYPAPNRRYVALTRFTVLDGCDVNQLALKMGNHKPVLIWNSPRPLECHWHPQSSFLAVADYVGKFCTVVIVFRIYEQKAPKLVYQTPYSETESRLNFYFKRWHPSANGIEISIYDIDRNRELASFVESLEDAHPEVTQNIYPASAVYGPLHRRK
jgi:hypothetical protein